jgi:Asp/Glu/hydantoin racemase
MNRLALLHTVPALVERFRRLLQAELAGLDSFHMVDESLLQDLMRHGPSPGITRRIVALATLAADGGADFILFTCSSTSPAIDVARQCIAVPILKIDDPLAEKAIELGNRIGILCTTNSTLQPSADLVRSHAQKLGRDVAVTPILVDQAYAALQAGHQEEHDALVSAKALELAEVCDVLVLAQASMAHLEALLSKRLSCPVLSSPPLIIEALRRARRGELSP